MEFTFQQKANKIALDKVYDTSPIGITGHFIVVMLVGYLLIGVVPFYIILQGVSIHLLILAMRSYNTWRYSKIQKTIDKPYEVEHWTSRHL